jgi:hypothetical protein
MVFSWFPDLEYIGPFVPDLDLASAILALRNYAFEPIVAQRMIFDLDG